MPSPKSPRSTRSPQKQDPSAELAAVSLQLASLIREDVRRVPPRLWRWPHLFARGSAAVLEEMGRMLLEKGKA